jgi:hypothetical protein
VKSGHKTRNITFKEHNLFYIIYFIELLGLFMQMMQGDWVLKGNNT